MRLEKEKRERIINAALAEFAQKGYKNASTNEIVKEANISKGLLFHYFKSKSGLYIFLFDYASEVILKDFYNRVNFKETDFFERFAQIVNLKISMISQYPDIYTFLASSLIENSPEVKKELGSKTEALTKEGYERTFEGIDYSKFKDDVDVKIAVNIIMWTIDGYSNREIEKLKIKPGSLPDYDKIMPEFNLYMAQLKKCFYK